MAPTICSGKKRQTRTIATTNIRRHGQGPHQLDQTFSNIVNLIAKDSRVPVTFKKQTHNQTERNLITTVNFRGTNNESDLIYNYLMQTSATSASNHRLQQYSFITDNAVTSSTHSDTENSSDLRLANEILGNNTTTTATYGSNTTNTSNSTSLSPSTASESSSLPSHKETASSPKSQCQERLFQRYSIAMQTHKFIGHPQDGSDSEETNLHENGTNIKLNPNEQITELHSSTKRKAYFSCDDFDSDEDELVRAGESIGDTSADGSDTDMETDDTDSMTSLDTEKSAKLKQRNHPIMRDNHFVKHPTKSPNNKRNTDGLLSIAIKTIKLVKRNQLLQQRLTQLQFETSEFIQSVLANPENRHFRENIKQKA